MKSKNTLTVNTLLQEKQKDWQLEVLAGESGLNKKISSREVHRPGLLLAGFSKYFPYDRVQVMGKTEMAYLKNLPSPKQQEAVKRLYKYPLVLILLTRRLTPLPIMIKLSDKHRVPLLSCPYKTPLFTPILSDYLAKKLAPRITIHGTFVDILGAGVLLSGRSGIGKSECALDLVERGHVLVADDIIELIQYPTGCLTGTSAAPHKRMQHYMEIRGIGLIDIYSLYGVRAIREDKRVDLYIELVDWSETLDYERLGIEEKYREFLGVKLPHIRIPLNPGKNISTLLELVAMNFALKRVGINPPQNFQSLLLEKLTK